MPTFDERLRRFYWGFLTVLFGGMGVVSLWIATMIWRTSEGGERWAGLALTLVTGLVFLGVARHTSRKRRFSEGVGLPSAVLSPRIART